MKRTYQLLTVATAALLLASCQKVSDYFHNSNHPDGQGDVYTMTNEASGNRVVHYTRSNNGTLTLENYYATGDNGTGAGLGNQGAVLLSEGNHLLFAVNAGSNTVSMFKVEGNGLQLLSSANSGGTTPVSLTMSGNILYVLNAGSPANISGFKLTAGGLSPIAGSIKPLSGDDVGPAQISFTANGKALVITEKATNTITTYTVNNNGVPLNMHTITSANPTPFGFSAGHNGLVFVSEAAGGADGASAVSSYNVANDGSISKLTGPVFTGQTAACWLVINDNGKYAYTTNTGSGNISSFDINNAGHVSVLNANAASIGAGTKPVDAAFSDNSKFLYVLNSGNSTISSFRVANDGQLYPVETTSGLPSGTNGLAAN